jgi:hypothetical protein
MDIATLRKILDSETYGENIALCEMEQVLAEYDALNDEYVKALNLITEISDHCPYDANEASYILGMVYRIALHATHV